ncbi:MAG: hypothetical protein JSV02_10905 [Dehalococcoidia bacterium]|nr:MAG: hypothetical protein JSV02_10905 [Dehalococcoidia bacterium]
MSQQIKIRTGTIEGQAQLNDTDTAMKVLNVLPITSRVNIWGDEIYFTIPVDAKLENGQETVRLGDIAYWPEGRALCIFFGDTPISEGDEIRPISAVTVIGHIDGDREVMQGMLSRLKAGEKLIISA